MEKFVNRYFISKEAEGVVEYSIGFLGGAPGNTPIQHMMPHIDITMCVLS